jgi:template-activating factor I
VADVIKEDLWPNPLKYFNNEFEEELELLDDDDEVSDDDDEEEDDEDQGEGEEDGEEN